MTTNNKPWQAIVTNENLSKSATTENSLTVVDKKMVEVEMIAENLGSIPPNTAFLEVISGAVYHRLFLVSTKNKSAKVRFIYDKEASKKPQVVAF